MCPFLSRCNHQINPTSHSLDLGCTTSRSWAEINDQVSLRLTKSDQHWKLLLDRQIHSPCNHCKTLPGFDNIFFQFGEPLGSYRKRDRFGLTCCHSQTSQTSQMSGMSDIALDCEEMIHHDHHLDAGTVLDISFRKQQQVLLEDLYRKVLIQNTTKTVQQEIKKTILQSIF